jgi:hypothetical protein
VKNIYTWAANPAKRTVTVGDIIEAKGKKILTQVTANNSLEGKFPGPENSVNVNEEILENFKKKL